MPFHNPYHFVPVKSGAKPDDLAVADFATGKVGQVTHDRFVSQTSQGTQTQPVYSGRLVCRLTTEDPIVIGDKREQLPDGSYRVSPFLLEGKPAIPASTLRGLISSITEAASNSALRVLEDRLFSYRAGMQESLPAIGMVVEERDANGIRRKLRPLALPPLQWDNRSSCAEIPPAYRAMFKEPRLKVYIDGYRRKAKAQPPELEATPNSFLYRLNPNSHSADHQKFWYLKLAGSCSLQGFSVMSTAPHISSRGWLLGQEAVTNEEPISEAEYQKLPPDQQKQYTRGILRVLSIEGRAQDIPTTKKHEIFLLYPPEMETAPVFEAEEALRTFETLAAERTAVNEKLPFHLKGSRRNANPNPENHDVQLRPGDLVFFKPDSRDHSKVGEVAISSIWRRRAGGSSYDYFREISPEVLPFHKDRKQLTIAEQLFGFAEYLQETQKSRTRAYALASRLRFSFGLLHTNQNDPYKDDPYEPEIPLKVLDSPKPPSPALYFKRRDGQGTYVAKSALNPRSHVPQGRKFYLHRQGNTGTPWKTLAPEDNLKQKSRVRPLRPGHVFYFHIDFDNLSQRELGLLCYAVRPTDNFRHKLGMGKPIGLGEVRIDPVGLFYIDRKVRYQETSLFEATRYHGSWLPTDGNPAIWPGHYVEEKQAAERGTVGFPAFDTLRQSFRDGMDPDIRQALELLGDPAKTRRHSVHTPQVAGVSGQAMEREAYKWFVANDIGSGSGEDKIGPQKKFLEPLNASTTNLPTLPEHPWSD